MISRKLSVRVQFLQQYLVFLGYLETEVRYSRRMIFEIVRGYNCDNEFSNFLRDVCSEFDDKQDLDDAWNAAISNLPECYGLLPRDKELLWDFGRQLGGSDAEGQVALCQMNRGLVDAALQEAIVEKTKKSKLYFILGSSFGVCLAIVLL